MLPKESRKNDCEFKLGRRVVFLATNNIHKFKEARKVLSEKGISVGMLRVKSLEIQSDNLKEIAATSAIDAFKRCHLPIIVEDAGLFIDALKGFPGPYSAYVFKTLGNKGILKLLKEEKKRDAHFESVIAYCENDNEEPVCFEGKVFGEITGKEANPAGGFGFDPIFKPDKAEKTFAEMSTDEKNSNSHRANALREFVKWYKPQT